ncbi:hypothetical protein B0H12DRAFT_230219 [Mycena haematopus]|nr:hypothetical protein B0H12DRAFT_230219 [Mycena haematopus]
MDAASDAVPPTTHEIPHTDRLRMMRSMRKLTAILGETPVVETYSPAPHSLAPDSGKRGFFFHASASLSSLVLPSKKSDTLPAPEHRPSLVLRMPDTFEPLPSPLSPGFSPTLMSPTSPQEEQPDSDRRRLCLSKVSRTLGENVPPELILPESGIKRRRRASSLILPESSLEHQTFAALAVAGVLANPPLSTRRPDASEAIPADPDADVDVVPDETLGEVHVHPVTSSSPDTLSQPEGSWLRSTSSVVFSTPDIDREPMAFANLGAPPTYEESHRDGPRTESRLSYIPPPDGTHPDAMQRHEDEWTGEWEGAARNMEDIMRQLRGLKVK